MKSGLQLSLVAILLTSVIAYNLLESTTDLPVTPVTIEAKPLPAQALLKPSKTADTLAKTPTALASDLNLNTPSADVENELESGMDITPVSQDLIDSGIAQAEIFSSWLQKNLTATPDFNLGNEMQKRFDQEPVDPFWAEQQEQQLQNIFTRSADFSGIALQQALCRSSQCMLSIAISDTDQANQVVELVSKAIQSDNTFYSVIAAPDEQQGMTKLFISKEGNSFQFN